MIFDCSLLWFDFHHFTLKTSCYSSTIRCQCSLYVSLLKYLTELQDFASWFENMLLYISLFSLNMRHGLLGHVSNSDVMQ